MWKTAAARRREEEPLSTGLLFPVAVGSPAGEATLRRLREEAIGEGNPEVRLQGFAARGRPYTAEVAHCFFGIAAVLTGILRPGVGLWATALVLFSMGLRLSGRPGLSPFSPRIPAWNLHLRRCRPDTRFLLATAADRFVPAPFVPPMVAVALVFAFFSNLGNLEWHLAAAAVLLVAALVSWLMGRPPAATAQSREQVAIACLGTLARSLSAGAPGEGRRPGRPDVAVLVSGAGAERAEGFLAALDWWGLTPEEAEVVLVVPGVGVPQGPRGPQLGGDSRTPTAPAAQALLAQGYRVTVVDVAEPERFPALLSPLLGS